MELFLCILFLTLNGWSHSEDDSIDYNEEGFERDIQPTPTPVPVLPVANSSTSTHYSGLVYSQPIFAEAIIRGPSNVRGLVFFQNSWNGVGLYGIVCGLRPGNHGFHIHQYGSLSLGCDHVGNHFSIYRYYHGGPTDRYRHNGDLGNLQADRRGIAYINQFNGQISLKSSNDSVLGRAIVIHEWPDDLGVGKKESNTTGNTGKAIACGLIGLRHDKPQFPSSCPPPNL